MKISTVFFGTHDFAATILQGLIDSPFFEVTLVISRPDEPAGRKQIIEKTPVKLLAERHNICVEQPKSLKDFHLPSSFFSLGVTAQYGGLIPGHILETPKYGILNVHTSLLPKYRGASPIQSAILNGETETGVTIMKMDEGLDTGAILLQKVVPIGEGTTAPELETILADIGSHALLEAIPPYLDGTLKPKEQNHAQATTCKKLTRDDGKIDWGKTSSEIYNLYRATQPWPGVWTIWNGKRLKILKLRNNPVGVAPTAAVALAGNAGSVETQDHSLHIVCGQGSIEVLGLQLEGKNPMDAKTFLNGYKDFAHAHLA